MNREIRFRGQKPENQEWVFGNLLKTSVDKKSNPAFTTGIQVFEQNEFKAVYQVLPETVGQFTGLKDKNGVDIYEGDILQYGEGSIWSRFEVVWNKRYCQFNLDCSRVSPNISFPTFDALDSMFLIGNIHSNPELLNNKS